MILNVSSETGKLSKLLIHSPDSGLGKVVPSKAQDWLFEDIVHLPTIRRGEYDYYVKLLLYFLDPDKIKGKLKTIDQNPDQRDFFIPGTKDYFRSDKVIELQQLLIDILQDADIKQQLVAAVAALEACSFTVQKEMMQCDPMDLARLFFSGTTPTNQMLFAPIPNFIFTRDIGIVINDHILLNRPLKDARKREALLAKYVFFHHAFFKDLHDRILELQDPPQQFLLPEHKDVPLITLEGGDVMVVSPDHVVIGISERTSQAAASQAAEILLSKNIVKKVTIVQIPNKRDYMHIDTVFTQVKRNCWVLLGSFARPAQQSSDSPFHLPQATMPSQEEVIIKQYTNQFQQQVKVFDYLSDLLLDISYNDLHCEPNSVQLILSGNNQFPYDVREQWTDSCNLLALQEGVVVGYDRNDYTISAFEEAGFNIIKVEDLLQQLENNLIQCEELKDTFILMPSSELSRARGGFHCMSMPLVRS
jgi:arginine deiminase